MDEAYDALARGEPGDVFEHLPVDDILNALCETYEDFEPAAKFPIIEDGHGSAEVFQAAYRFLFSFRGDSSDLQERIVGIFRGFVCPVYDPQTSSLYPLDGPFAGRPRIEKTGWNTPSQSRAELQEEIAAMRAEPKRSSAKSARKIGHGTSPSKSWLFRSFESAPAGSGSALESTRKRAPRSCITCSLPGRGSPTSRPMTIWRSRTISTSFSWHAWEPFLQDTNVPTRERRRGQASRGRSSSVTAPGVTAIKSFLIQSQ